MCTLGSGMHADWAAPSLATGGASRLARPLGLLRLGSWPPSWLSARGFAKLVGTVCCVRLVVPLLSAEAELFVPPLPAHLWRRRVPSSFALTECLFKLHIKLIVIETHARLTLALERIDLVFNFALVPLALQQLLCLDLFAVLFEFSLALGIFRRFDARGLIKQALSHAFHVRPS